MNLFDLLTEQEADQLWWRLIRAAADVCDELEQLERCPPQLAADLYGRNVVASFRGMRDDLIDVLDLDLGQNPAIGGLVGGDGGVI